MPRELETSPTLLTQPVGGFPVAPQVSAAQGQGGCPYRMGVGWGSRPLLWQGPLILGSRVPEPLPQAELPRRPLSTDSV